MGEIIVMTNVHFKEKSVKKKKNFKTSAGLSNVWKGKVESRQ